MSHSHQHTATAQGSTFVYDVPCIRADCTPQSWHERARANELPPVDRTGQYSTLGRAAIVATLRKVA